MDYHEWEVNIHSVHDQKFIGHVRLSQYPNENSSGCAKPTKGLQPGWYTKLVRIVGPSEEGSWKEVMFTQDQLVAESARHKRCDCTNTLGKVRISTHGSRDDIIHLQQSQLDMASRRFIGSTRKTERIYDSLIRKEVGESCLFWIKST
jgi:hypothetical protein